MDKNFIEKQVAAIRAQVGDKKVLLGLSGGVDSSVCAALIHKAIGNNLICVFVNHGLLRKGEFEQVQQVFKDQFGMNLVAVDAEDRFGKIPAAEVLLVADRRKWGAVTESFLLTEFVEGEILGRLPRYREKYGNAVAALLARMHAAGIVHGDVHERNFVLRKKADAAGGEEVVAIDMSGKRATPFTRAEDRIRLEWTFGVKNARDDWGAKMFLAKRRLRNFFRRLRGKPQLRA